VPPNPSRRTDLLRKFLCGLLAYFRPDEARYEEQPVRALSGTSLVLTGLELAFDHYERPARKVRPNRQ
jgi:hypothetical protein